jgi:hypothetical protein
MELNLMGTRTNQMVNEVGATTPDHGVAKPLLRFDALRYTRIIVNAAVSTGILRKVFLVVVIESDQVVVFVFGHIGEIFVLLLVIVVIARFFLVVLLIVLFFVIFIFIVLVISFYETRMRLFWVSRTIRCSHDRLVVAPFSILANASFLNNEISIDCCKPSSVC